MKLVLHVVAAGEIGGAERMLVDLASGEPAGFAHAVALYSASRRLTEWLGRANVTIFDRGPAREDALSFLARSLGRAPEDLARLARAAGASVVHVHTHGSQVLGTRAALVAGLPVVRTEHSTRVYEDRSTWPFARWSLRRAARVVAISEHVASVVRARAPWVADRLRVVYNGVDVARRAPAPLPEGGPVRFALVGRLEPRKGVDVALRALAKVPEAHLAIVGDGESRAQLERLARELGVADRARFLGFVDDVDRAAAECHAVLSSSRREGLGLAILEGMALGRPAVALPVGGLPEFVSERTGWLARGTDPAALAEAMRACAASAEALAARGAAARELVVARFSLEAMRRGYDRVYEEATARTA